MTTLMANNNEQLINKIIYLMQNDASFSAPADSVKWAKNIFRSRMAKPEKSFVQKVIAVLKMDLLPSQTAFGERSGASSVRQMLFEAEDNKIDLRITADENTYSLRGQILGKGFENCLVVLGDKEVLADEMSEFSISGILKGEYSLTIKKEENEIVIGKINFN